MFKIKLVATFRQYFLVLISFQYNFEYLQTIPSPVNDTTPGLTRRHSERGLSLTQYRHSSQAELLLTLWSVESVAD